MDLSWCSGEFIWEAGQGDQAGSVMFHFLDKAGAISLWGCSKTSGRVLIGPQGRPASWI